MPQQTFFQEVVEHPTCARAVSSDYVAISVFAYLLVLVFRDFHARAGLYIRVACIHVCVCVCVREC